MTKRILGTLLGLYCGGMMLLADDAEKAERSGPGMVLGEPLWRSQVSDNEPVLFIQEEGKQLATGRLLFIPSEKFRITHPDHRMKYEEGKDFTWKPGTNIIELTPTSRIPFKTAAQMVPPKGSPNMFATVLHSEGRFFHDLQVQVSYWHKTDPWPLPPEPRPEQLTRVLAKLRSKQPIKLVALGDSITQGLNASGFKESLAEPFQPAYPQLVANTLQKRFGSKVTLVNFGVAGTEAGWGVEMIPKVTAEKPDLVLLAFGMNDGGGYDKKMTKMRDGVIAENPDADIVLVAPMTMNPRFAGADGFQWKSKFLGGLVTTNVALADVTTPWIEILKKKPYSDLSGNNVNHPNDFGHRLYAHVILDLFPLKAEVKERAEQPKDPLGILKKPIPERLVVFTFDDGCASHATVAAPILKKHGFNGTFYVSDAYLFRERKDWYMTWRQIRAMSEQGFEIGNHTRGHGQLSMTDVGGCQAYVWTLEDAMIANRIPRPTTFCWPFYDVNTKFYPLLASWGYTFARGGHGRTYDPTADNPFDVPSFAAGGVGQTMEGMISASQQATAGKVVVMTFHGTPDMEHPGVGIDPDLFEEFVEYLKANNYKVVAMRDLVEYIDPAKAAQLPPTKTTLRTKRDAPGAPALVKGDKPYTAKKRAPKEPQSGDRKGPWTVKEIYRLKLPDAVSTSINGSTIAIHVPASTDVKALAPVFELARFAKSEPASGTARDFTTPQIYKITAQDGSPRDYTVKVIPTKEPIHFSWMAKEDGSFDDGARWKNNLGADAGPSVGGNSDSILSFNEPGKYTVSRTGDGDFVLNQLNLGRATLTLESKGSFVFNKSSSFGASPYINSQSRANVTIKVPVRLDADLTVDGLEADDTRVFLNGAISGKGALIKNGPHELHLGNPINTYAGGTVINGGSLSARPEGLGAGPVTINEDGAIGIGGEAVKNSLIANGGSVFTGGSGHWGGPVKINGNTKLRAENILEFSNKQEGISGPGGITQVGQPVGHTLKSGTIKLFGRNTYSGLTMVEMGLLEIKSSLYSNEPARWTPANITINGAAGELRLHIGGPDSFTAAQAGTMLKNLSTDINRNGLMAGSTFGLDTTGATEPQEISINVTDSKGPGGGSILLKKCGAGILKLTGANTYSGQTIIEGGTLSADSLNSVVNGMPASSLGAPKTESDGEIFLSRGSVLNYTGKGETTDRTLNFPGGNDAVSLSQSGTGLLKLTSPFVISGYGENKTIILTGSAAGAGEIACNVENPYDRKGGATTAITKNGTGKWTLSGANTFTGPVTINGGTLAIASERSVSAECEITIASGGKLELNFKGRMNVRKLTLEGKEQPAGTYPATSASGFIAGTGVLIGGS